MASSRRPIATVLLFTVLLALIALSWPGPLRASSMTLPRVDHTATLLADGRVLVAGGNTATAAELYDPAGDSWSLTGALAYPRFRAAAVRLADGRVLVVGGAPGAPRSAEIYDPTTGRWRQTAPMSVDRRSPAAALLTDGRVLVVGGASSATSEIYDPAADSWAPAANNPGGPRDNGPAAATLGDGRVIVVGGSFAFTSSLELYTPATDSWAFIRLEQPLLTPSLVILPDGRALITGGWSEPYGLLFDPVTGAVTATARPPVALFGQATTLLGDGRALVLGGTAGNVSQRPLIFDPDTGRWLFARALITPRFSLTATRLSDGRALIAGGRLQNGAAIAGAELYDPAGAALDQLRFLPLAAQRLPQTLVPTPHQPLPTQAPRPTPSITLGPGQGTVRIVDIVLRDPVFPQDSEEYVLINNRDGGRVELGGWRLINASRPDGTRGPVPPFVFPSFVIDRDITIAVFSQAGEDDLEIGDFYWDQPADIWRVGDRAELRDAAGNLVQTFVVPQQ